MTTTSRAARSLVAVGVAGTASVLGVGAASAAPSTSVDHLATATSVRPVGASTSTSVAAAVASPLPIDIGDWLGRPPWGCFVCGLGGFPPIDDLVMPSRGL